MEGSKKLFTVTVVSSLPSPCTAFSSPSRSIHFGDVCEANGRESGKHLFSVNCQGILKTYVCGKPGQRCTAVA